MNYSDGIFVPKTTRIRAVCANLLIGLSCLYGAVASIGLENRPAPPVQWRGKLTSWTDSTPAISPDGTVYLGTFDGTLQAISSTGDFKWAFAAKSEIWSSPALGSDGTIYFGSRDRYLYALKHTGGLRWTFRTGGWVDSSAALATNGNVIFGSWDHNLYAVGPEGRKQWAFTTGGPVVSSPAIDQGGNIYFGSHDKKFYALRPDGSLIWAFNTSGPIASSPALDAEGRVYFTSTDGFLYALGTNDGGILWKLKIGSYLHESPVLGLQDRIYVTGDREFKMVSPDGRLLWSRGKEPLLATPLATANAAAVFVYINGQMVVREQDQEWEWIYHASPGGSGSPVITPSGQVLFLAAGGLQIQALQAETTIAPTAWPKFRGNLRNTGNLADRN
jgi:outer membrane protein assembly factor BamB